MFVARSEMVRGNLGQSSEKGLGKKGRWWGIDTVDVNIFKFAATRKGHKATVPGQAGQVPSRCQLSIIFLNWLITPFPLYNLRRLPLRLHAPYPAFSSFFQYSQWVQVV